MKQKTKKTTLLTEITRRLTKVGNPEKIVLLGSRSRGTTQVESDYDLLVIENSVLPRHKRASKHRRALKGLPNSRE